jgi:hypothetical protein
VVLALLVGRYHLELAPEVGGLEGLLQRRMYHLTMQVGVQWRGMGEGGGGVRSSQTGLLQMQPARWRPHWRMAPYCQHAFDATRHACLRGE